MLHIQDVKTGLSERVEVGAAKMSGSGYIPGRISADGRYVVFHKQGPVIDVNRLALMLLDRKECLMQSVPFNTNTGTTPFSPSLSDMTADGREIVFSSGDPNLVPNDPNPMSGDIFVGH